MSGFGHLTMGFGDPAGRIKRLEDKVATLESRMSNITIPGGKLRVVSTNIVGNTTLTHTHAGSAQGGTLALSVLQGTISAAQHGTIAGGDAHPVYLLESVLTAKGDIYAATASGAVVRHGSGADGQILVYNSASADGLQNKTPRVKGTSTIASGTTNVDVTHGAGTTPLLQDIYITPGTVSPTNDPGHLWVDTIGSVTFRVNCRTDPGASGMPFGWGVLLV